MWYHTATFKQFLQFLLLYAKKKKICCTPYCLSFYNSRIYFMYTHTHIHTPTYKAQLPFIAHLLFCSVQCAAWHSENFHNAKCLVVWLSIYKWHVSTNYRAAGTLPAYTCRIGGRPHGEHNYCHYIYFWSSRYTYYCTGIMMRRKTL